MLPKAVIIDNFYDMFDERWVTAGYFRVGKNCWVLDVRTQRGTERNLKVLMCRLCGERFGHTRARETAMVKTLALCQDAINYAKWVHTLHVCQYLPLSSLSKIEGVTASLVASEAVSQLHFSLSVLPDLSSHRLYCRFLWKQNGGTYQLHLIVSRIVGDDDAVKSYSPNNSVNCWSQIHMSGTHQDYVSFIRGGYHKSTRSKVSNSAANYV